MSFVSHVCFILLLNADDPKLTESFIYDRRKPIKSSNSLQSSHVDPAFTEQRTKQHPQRDAAPQTSNCNRGMFFDLQAEEGRVPVVFICSSHASFLNVSDLTEIRVRLSCFFRAQKSP